MSLNTVRHTPYKPFVGRPGKALRRSRPIRALNDKDAKTKRDVETYTEALKEAGMSPEVAKQVIDKWKEVGADADPSLLRKLFLQQSITPIAGSVLQLLFDAFAAYAAFISSVFFALGPDFFGRGAVVFLDQFISVYFTFVVLFDLVALVVVVVSAVKLGTNPEAFYSALKSIAASPVPGLAIADKAQAVVNALKVSQAIDAIARLLEAPTKDPSKESLDMLRDLNVLLTLQRAEKTGKFDLEELGLTKADAQRLADVFGQADANDDGYVDVAELRRMLAGLGLDLGEAEAKAAIQVMDTNGDGEVEFPEFVQWWAARRKASGR